MQVHGAYEGAKEYPWPAKLMLHAWGRYAYMLMDMLMDKGAHTHAYIRAAG